MPDTWLQLAVRGDSERLDAVANFLIERGSPGVEIKKSEVRGYFPAPFDLASIRRDVQKFLSGSRRRHRSGATSDLTWRIVKDEDWNKRWRKFIKPQKVGRSFWITPPWIAAPKLRRHVITIEPGMAFGTGSHATTRGCLEFIEQIARKLKGQRWAALDVGTGSGILSIALAKLGAEPVWAIDNDPVALAVARENLHCNGAQRSVRLSVQPLARVRKTFALVVANLTAETIMHLSAPLAGRVASGGHLILSGILHSKADHVIATVACAGFDLLKRKREKQWTTLLLRRQKESMKQRERQICGTLRRSSGRTVNELRSW